MTWLLPLPVLLPLLGAALCLVLRRSARAQRIVSFAVLLATVAVATALILITADGGPLALWLGAWEEPLGVALVADRLTALMLLVSSIVVLVVLVFSIGQGIADGEGDTPLTVFFPTYLVLSAGVSNAFLAGDLFNLFVGFEILLFASYVLLTLGGLGPRIRAGTTYVVVSLLSSFLFLVAIAAVYAAAGTTNLAQLALRLRDIDPHVALVLQILLLTVFGIKAAVFPMSAWLPDSYPTAPAPVTAVFAGLLTKVGVYAIIRTQTLLFPDSPLTTPLMWVALLTMVVGILGAVAQTGIKRILSFTLVSHIGYMIFGVALADRAGLSGAVFYVAHHITIQTALFLVAGLIDRASGTTSLEKLGGLAAISPALGILFFAGAMNLSGIPPMSGFIAKTGLLQAAVGLGTPLAYVLVAGMLVTSLLTLYVMAKTWSQAFWRTPSEALASVMARRPDLDPEAAARREGVVLQYDLSAREPAEALDDEEDTGRAGETPSRALPTAMMGAATAMIVVSLAITLLAGPMFGYADNAARDMLQRTPYIDAVLPAGVR
ncbi:Na+/H+ antiporter subunit D [Cumulibacter manganitolerans]|uniref:Na+/H+ antiporter subunit D n=1 Tax=Cumulibacter manganitolerans TaxID=1884992 RepID=UPI001294C284|nr:Na+/H+ antiporter subunit D [Cumulibacter manganitolerans]